MPHQLSHIAVNVYVHALLTGLRYHTYAGDKHHGTLLVTLDTYISDKICRLF